MGSRPRVPAAAQLEAPGRRRSRGTVVAVLSAQSLASAREGAATYQVQSGDTLSAIAIATGIPVDKLISLNSLRDPNVIIAGQTLSVAPSPVATSAPVSSTGQPAQPQQHQPNPAAGRRIHSQRRRHPLGHRQANGITLDELLQVNNLSNADQLTLGQTLRLPVTATALQRSATLAGPKRNPPSRPRPAAHRLERCSTSRHPGAARRWIERPRWRRRHQPDHRRARGLARRRPVPVGKRHEAADPGGAGASNRGGPTVVDREPAGGSQRHDRHLRQHRCQRDRRRDSPRSVNDT